MVEKIRVATYIRVSTTEQEKKYGLEMQKNNLDDYIKYKKDRGWHTKPQWEFIEQGSGGDTNRKELNKLFDLVKKKEIDIVVVWKIDRMSRSLSDLLGIIEFLKNHDVGFASYKEDMDFTGPIGKLIFQIFGSLAEFERETIKMRTMEGKKASAQMGNYVGGNVPYGFEVIKNPNGKGSKFNILKTEGNIVKQIFKWYAYDRMNLTQIAKRLNEIGVKKGKSANKQTKGTKWHDQNIKSILTNPIYRGAYITNRYLLVRSKPKKIYNENPKEEWIITPVKPIVDISLFSKVQAMLSKGKNKGKRGGGQNNYLFQSKLIETNSNKGYIGYKSDKGTKHYRRKKFIDANGVVNPSTSIAESILNDYVWSLIEKALNNPKRFLEIYKKQSDNHVEIEKLGEKMRFYEKALSKANDRINAVEESYYDREIEKDKRDEHLCKYNEEKDNASVNLNKINEKLQRLSEYDTACDDLKHVSKNMAVNLDKIDYEQKKAIVQMLVERIEITETDIQRKIKVYFRFNQRAIDDEIPKVNSGSGLPVNKKPSSDSKKKGNGNEKSQGYFLFTFEQVLAYKDFQTNKYKLSEAQFLEQSKALDNKQLAYK